MAEASLQTLSQLLEKHYGQKVILLIDEYDVPLDKAFQGGYYDEMVSLIRNLLGNALKTNDSLYFAVLTGCLRISKESIFTGLNNMKVHTISDVRYDEYFGFTNADDGNLEKACTEALEQIEEKKYAQGLKRRSMKKIIKYGIAFYEKECMVVMGDLKVKDTTPIPRWL